ncbi:hypothetical protein [Pseudidiomarina gelatinasegens]|uniref:hypothetical protein n=1 Tax=Pseudidiomarina gelatinasegens TaxID=2487740 RepID=UPI0030EF1E65
MADYINKNILSQAYIHVEPSGIETDEQFEAFRAKLRNFALSRTEFFLSDALDVQIEFEEGSIKTRVTVIGTLILLLQGISSYKDFREGLQLLYADSKWLSDAIISESLFQAKAKHHNVIRVEARTGIIGSVHKILNQLERIKSGAYGTMLASDIVEKIDDVKDELLKLMENICDPADRNLVAKECQSLLQQLPENPIPPKDKTNSHYAINDYRRKKLSLINSVKLYVTIE